MKNVLRKVIIVLTAFLICYLLGSFCEGSFDISKWNLDTREGVVTSFLILSYFALFFDL